MEDLDESVRRAGEKKARLEKHHEEIWSEHVTELVVLKNKMRKNDVSTKSIMKTRRAEKAKMRAQVKGARNSRFLALTASYLASTVTSSPLEHLVPRGNLLSLQLSSSVQVPRYSSVFLPRQFVHLDPIPLGRDSEGGQTNWWFKGWMKVSNGRKWKRQWGR